MRDYAVVLRKHLAEYAHDRLGVRESGTWEGRTYRHILPEGLRYLNFLEGFRSEVTAHLKSVPKVKLHRDFHHLNSSQAFALNLFFPFFSSGAQAAAVLTTALGTSGAPTWWELEHVPNPAEGTNVDVAWRLPDGTQMFCEVKLSENQFGGAKADPRHKAKLRDIYRPRLDGLVPEECLDERWFFPRYQILRMISLLATTKKGIVVFLLPKENQSAVSHLQEVLAKVTPAAANRIRVAHIETVLRQLTTDEDLAPRLTVHANQLVEKYLPPVSGRG
jgi:hypothetical protein